MCPIDFDGIDDFVDVPDSTDWDIFSGDFTYSVWINLNQIGVNNGLVGQYQDANNFWGIYVSDANAILVYDKSGGGSQGYYSAASFSPVVGTWYHIVVIRSGSSTSIYVNGVSEAVTEIVSWNSPGSKAANLYLGKYYSIPFVLDGVMDEAAIWKGTALSSSEVLQLYNPKIKHMPLQIQAANLKGYWPLDDGPAGASADGDNVRDLSGNGNDGTGDDGSNNTGLTWKAEEVLNYPPSAFPVITIGSADLVVSGTTVNLGNLLLAGNGFFPFPGTSINLGNLLLSGERKDAYQQGSPVNLGNLLLAGNGFFPFPGTSINLGNLLLSGDAKIDDAGGLLKRIRQGMIIGLRNGVE